MKFKGAFEGCSWCHGNGCMQCDVEREAWAQAQAAPLFEARLDNEEDMDLLAEAINREAILKAYSGGGGHREIVENLFMARLKQALRSLGTETTDD